MGRRAYARTRNVWMNGHLVGEWRILRNNVTEYQYDQSWLANREARRPAFAVESQVLAVIGQD